MASANIISFGNSKNGKQAINCRLIEVLPNPDKPEYKRVIHMILPLTKLCGAQGDNFFAYAPTRNWNQKLIILCKKLSLST